MTEGRGPMVIVCIFSDRKDAENYIDNKLGVMGRKAEWSTVKYGDWDVKEYPLYHSLELLEKNEKDEMAAEAHTSALKKLTDREIEALKKIGI